MAPIKLAVLINLPFLLPVDELKRRSLGKILSNVFKFNPTKSVCAGSTVESARSPPKVRLGVVVTMTLMPVPGNANAILFPAVPA